MFYKLNFEDLTWHWCYFHFW